MKKTRKGLACLLAVVMALTALPAGALAAEDNTDTNGVAYIDGNGDSQTCTDATAVTSSDTTWGGTDGQTKWYVVSSDVTIGSADSRSRITVTGSVSLILTDGCTLTINGGIEVLGGKSLTIYGQTNGTGKLICQNVVDNYAGIGGNAGTTVSGNVDGNCGQITIHGGTTEVTGGSSGAGIGCGHNGTGGTINVTGGTVTAQGGSNGAGIGHGSGAEKSFGTITISGGTVTAKGGFGGAGIGGKGCNITISGESTQITAQGGSSGAGIGGSSGDAGTITISGGTVTAKGGTGGAGIGGGQYTGTNTTITITGGTVTVTGGGSNAADIGGGGTSSSGTLASQSITIGEGATVKTAEGGTPTLGPFHGVDTETWASDENNHWHPCMIANCNESSHQSGSAAHSYAASVNDSGTLVSACTTCGYVNESTYSGYSLNSITVTAQPNKLTYNGGEQLDLTGLAIKATYSNGTDNVEVSLSYNSTGVTCSPTHGTVLTTAAHNGTSITITFSGKTTTTNQLTVAGAFSITGGTNGTDYTYADNVLTVNDGANLTISMTDNTATTSDRIVIAQNATATITLDGVKIKAPQQTSAIDLSSGSKLTLILPTGTSSSLVGGTWDNTDPTSSGCAGIHVPVGAELNIQCSETDTHKCLEASCGKLSVKGEVKSAGIGGNGNEGCGTVVIDGGVVEATGNSGAGIGGGDHGSGGDITINGGIVTATGDGGAAGIGGAGEGGTGGKVTITGGIVTATGNGGAAGIGGGYMSAGGTVIITGGVVTATLVTSGGGNGAGIGGGAGADNGTFSTSSETGTGNAVIFASSNLVGNEIGDDDDTSNWNGVIFQGTQDLVYGNVTLTDSFTIPSGYTLTIPDGATLTIPDGVTITNNGTIDVVDSGKIEPENRVSGSGTVRQFYTVTFDANGHGTAPKETLVLKNGYITQPTALTADGYTFGGWYKDAECNTRWNFDTDIVTEKTTLYAKWTKDETPPTGTITVNENGWKSFINTITFNIFCKDKYDVTITAEDNETGVASVDYLISETMISAKDIINQTGWQTYSTTGFSIENDGKYIIYAKITDNSNNIAYISTNGMILDSQNPTKPTVSGYTSGTWTNRDVTLTVSGATALSGIAKYEYSTNGGASWNEMTVTKKTEASDTAPANVVKAQLTISGATDTAYLIRAVSNTDAYSETASVTVKIETTAPTIEGIANGETYCPNQTFTVSDDHLKEVIINNAPAQAENGVYTLTTEGECTVTATDEAGNSVTYTVTVGHNWNDTTYEWSADGKTCTAIYTCKNDNTHIETATATVTDTQTKAPTCTEKGETTYTAAFAESWAESKNTIRADIPAAGHSYEHHDAVSPECEQSGMEEHYTCKNCDLIFDKDKNATTPDDLTINATGHTFSAEWKTNGEKHWHECSCGAKTGESAHTFEWEIDKEAQVGVAGSKHEECTECGYAKAAVEIPALKAPEYPPVIDGSDGGKVTVNPENPQAGDEVTITPKPEDGKTVDKVIVTDENGKEIAVTDNGDGTYTFTQPDGKVTVKVTFKTEESKPSTDEKSPQTGDNSTIWLWFAILFVSGGGVIGTTVYGRKKKHSIK